MQIWLINEELFPAAINQEPTRQNKGGCKKIE